jgi:hypothetical protein
MQDDCIKAYFAPLCFPKPEGANTRERLIHILLVYLCRFTHVLYFEAISKARVIDLKRDWLKSLLLTEWVQDNYSLKEIWVLQPTVPEKLMPTHPTHFHPKGIDDAGRACDPDFRESHGGQRLTL